MAVPENAKNKEAAKQFVTFIVSKQAQQILAQQYGRRCQKRSRYSCRDAGAEAVPCCDVKLQTDDFLSSAFPWYLKLQESYYKHLIEAINNPPKDLNAWVKTTADKLREEQASLKSKG